jgi:hypothetical protein
MCQNESQSQRFIACRTDDQTTVGRDGFANYVVSTPSERPANARAACGVTWIPWGPQAGGVLIYRNMLPNPTFAQAIQRVPEQGKERAVMGDYFPRSRYYAGRAAFEKLGCKQLRRSNPVANKRCRDRTPPRSSIRHSAPEAAARGRFSGRSIDFGCHGGAHKRSRAGRVKQVLVTIDRRGHVCHWSTTTTPTEVRHTYCLAWQADLGRRRLDGKVPWRLRVPKFRRRFPPGRYVARVYATDAAGNTETKVRPTNRAYFRVR